MKKLLAVLSVLFLLISCTEQTNSNKFEFEKEVIYSQFDEIAEKIKEVDLKDFSGNPIFNIYGLSIDKNGDYYFYDDFYKKFFCYDSAGNYKSSIGKKGQGPGEYYIPSKSLFVEDDFCVFDVSKREMVCFDKENFKHSKNYEFRGNPSELIFNKNKFFAFTKSGKSAILIGDLEGNIVSEIFEYEENSLKKFRERFNYGDCFLDKQNNIWFGFPGEYSLKKYSSSGVLLADYFSTNSKYTPNIPNLPKDLNPFGISPAHLKFWDSYLHIFRLYNLRDEKIIVLLEESEKLNSQHFYINIHSFDGETLAEGIKVPDEIEILKLKDDFLYCKSKQTLLENGELSKPKIMIYKIII